MVDAKSSAGPLTPWRTLHIIIWMPHFEHVAFIMRSEPVSTAHVAAVVPLCALLVREIYSGEAACGRDRFSTNRVCNTMQILSWRRSAR